MNRKESLLRHAWLLYSDLNSRFNTLIDEYGHLQDTLFGLLPSNIDSDTLFSLAVEGAPEATERSSQLKTPYREVGPTHGSDMYHALPVSSRTFVSYIGWLGTLRTGLEKNKAGCLDAYASFVSLCRVDGEVLDMSAVDEAFFWFVAKRAHFVSEVFGFYAEQLEHAHEKLIQVLENSPGATPQPILLRRWNSATYEEYLSGYFAHAKWKVRELISDLLGRKIPAGNLTHSWTHLPTSQMNRFVLSGKRTTSTTSDFECGAVESAFFYLEQPALFPLLLHESAHFYFPVDDDDTAAGNVDGVSKSASPFFALRHDASETLRRSFPFPVQNKDWFDGFTREVWIDAIAIRLGGVPYVSALFSQILGHSLPSHYRQLIGSDGRWELFELANEERRSFEVNHPESSDEYLWEARLTLAIRLCQSVGLTRASVAETEWLESCSDVILTWQDGGGVVNRAAATSYEHESYWQYRRSINEWVCSVLWSYLEPSLPSLQKHEPSWNYFFEQAKSPRSERKSTNPVRSTPLAAISGAVGSYLKATLKATDKDVTTSLNSISGLVSIDACPIAVRWLVSEWIVKRFSMQSEHGDLRERIRAFSDYVRHDGHAAFRIAMEWHMARESAFTLVADIFRDANRDLTQLGEIPSGLLQQADEPNLSELGEFFWEKRYDNKVDALRLWLRESGRGTWRKSDKEVIAKFAEIGIDFANRQSQRVADALKDTVSNGDEIPVGTLSLGLIRPSEITVANTDAKVSPYGSALKRTLCYFHKIDDAIRERRKSVDIETEKGVFLGLIGDYSFLQIQYGITPVEGDIHALGMPKVLVKPRAVVRIANKMSPEFDNCLVGKVTLLRKKYRFQWLELADQLMKCEHTKAYQLFLSSGWEAVILITWHESMDAMQQARLTQGLIHDGNSGHDAQSAMAFPMETTRTQDAIDSQPCEWPPATRATTTKTQMDIAAHSGKRDSREESWQHSVMTLQQKRPELGIHTVYETMGRYDYTVVWDCERTTLPTDMVGLLAKLPAEFWKPVATYSTGIRSKISLEQRSPYSTYMMRLVLD